ncbi:4-carboxymuconolactone decarboxylase [Oceanicella actignis]|uniref:4-carboxymuconolactone decarboxylase/3-oxoadipate enol-lactonase / 4-carboxymuconolactone decarboxylase n=1 Tax=Oceanicella actignis TaxID=1189325 RepID=A0A1M7TFX1_9RHOB|nr:4-carboxymuconolactone decarboxylase [Oceanicella actignis]TYO88523.1 4-carboxymuconolactone decarboxylase/3-oxoadipate enol-lactonase/4-carboxymuconolactone decarboxylase [Oceanicella actignis]SET60588.1 4-carboxymuconolactone decarboxylase [Oceanicella actignis]SHN69654.1 4-carboxymuconolactone decarboxylase/3-oxoadipate enol-lactonase / 4-carboxymuconolactone decarboxylase [Oceanicella actignis]
MPDRADDPAGFSRRESGMRVRRQVLGDAHVERAAARATDFDAPFQEYIVEAAWGGVWARPGLGRRERSLVTLALLAALGHWEEFEMHLRATRNTGAAPAEVREALLHVAVYAGVPAANRAFAIAREVFAERAESRPQQEPAS